MSRPRSIFDSLPRSWRIFRHLAPRLRSERSHIATGLVALFAGVGLQILEPWPLKYVLDSIIQPVGKSVELQLSMDAMTIVTAAAIVLVLIAAARAYTEYWRTVRFALIGNRVISNVRSDLFRHLQGLSLSFHNRSRKGDLTVRVISDVNMLKEVVVSALLPLVSSVLVLIGMSCVMLWMHWKLSLIAFAALPFFWLFAVRSSRKIHDAARKQRKREGALAATASESMSSQQAVQALSLQDVFQSSFTNQNNKSAREGVKTSRLTAGLERGVDVMIAGASAVVLWQGSRYVIGGEMSPGGLIVFLTYLKRGFKPLQNFAKYAGRLSKATAAGERVVELLEQEVGVVDAANAVTAPPIQGHFRLENVSFCYAISSPILKSIDLVVPPGSHVALVGQSGIGKSTLLSLLMRLYEPQSGRILIDGFDIREWTIDSLRSQISVVLQDTILFAASVRENIAYACPDATNTRIEAAARLAAAHEFILSLPDGYDTQLGERGVNLSHGQRQRIAIARAAIRQSPILLLDEPTTALDEMNEQSLIRSLQQLAQGRTTFTVTHNLRLAAMADQIVCLENGCIAEHGSHHELMENNRTYAGMFRLQTGRGSWEAKTNVVTT